MSRWRSTPPSSASPSAAESGLVLRAATLAYLGVMVLLPLVALGYQAAEPGPSAFWKALTDPFAWHALKLTFATAGVMVVDQRRDRARRPPGSWSATDSPARGSSTP